MSVQEHTCSSDVWDRTTDPWSMQIPHLRMFVEDETDSTELVIDRLPVLLTAGTGWGLATMVENGSAVLRMSKKDAKIQVETVHPECKIVNDRSQTSSILDPQKKDSVQIQYRNLKISVQFVPLSLLRTATVLPVVLVILVLILGLMTVLPAPEMLKRSEPQKIPEIKSHVRFADADKFGYKNIVAIPKEKVDDSDTSEAPKKNSVHKEDLAIGNSFKRRKTSDLQENDATERTDTEPGLKRKQKATSPKTWRKWVAEAEPEQRMTRVRLLRVMQSIEHNENLFDWPWERITANVRDAGGVAQIPQALRKNTAQRIRKLWMGLIEKQKDRLSEMTDQSNLDEAFERLYSLYESCNHLAHWCEAKGYHGLVEKYFTDRVAQVQQLRQINPDAAEEQSIKLSLLIPPDHKLQTMLDGDGH